MSIHQKHLRALATEIFTKSLADINPDLAPLLMFDRILNVTLPNNLLKFEEDLRRIYPPLGLHKGTLDSPCFLILLIYTKHTYNKMKSRTDPVSSFP